MKHRYKLLFAGLIGISCIVSFSGIAVADNDTNWNETNLFNNQSDVIDYVNNSSETGFVYYKEVSPQNYMFIHENNTITGKDAHALAEFFNYTLESDYTQSAIAAEKIIFKEMLHLGTGDYPVGPVTNQALSQIGIKDKFGEYAINQEKIVIDMTHENASFENYGTFTNKNVIITETFAGTILNEAGETIEKQSTLLVFIAAIALIMGVYGIVKDFENH